MCACVHAYVSLYVVQRPLSLSVVEKMERGVNKQWHTVAWKTLRAQL